MAMFVLYGLLCLGALTTLYPFVLMATTGLKGPTDQNDNKLIPSFLRQDDELFEKYVDDKYAGDASLIASTRLGEEASPESLAQYEAFLMELPDDFWAVGFRMAPNQVTSRLRLRYQAWLRDRYRDIDDLNKAYVEENVGFQTIDPPAELLERRTWKPLAGRKYDEWLEFKRSLPAEFRIPMRSQRMYQEFVRARYGNRFSDVPPEVAGTATAFEGIAMPPEGPLLEEFRREYLPERYHSGTAEELWARRMGTDEPMPIVAFERAHVAENARGVRREFASRNFVYVLDYILLNGRAVWNTAIFCFLAIATQLIVNPIAAYALSRYPIKASGKILIFLLATMAFPAEVAMIPSFLLLKDLGLLNTFAALVLPTMASGYMIFLLKGFFDSLPQELFEAGQIDGARETTMMTRIALPLSKPVLGYLALIAFMGAYGAFLYAFLVAQDQRMWTLMVWIYQLQNTAPKAVMMAAVTLAAVPTLAVFLLAQRVIMRGIVLPGER
jgi:multiple sugar transport system permease protein